jgi:hypothetical protein
MLANPSPNEMGVVYHVIPFFLFASVY